MRVIPVLPNKRNECSTQFVYAAFSMVRDVHIYIYIYIKHAISLTVASKHKCVFLSVFVSI